MDEIMKDGDVQGRVAHATKNAIEQQDGTEAELKCMIIGDDRSGAHQIEGAGQNGKGNASAVRYQCG